MADIIEFLLFTVDPQLARRARQADIRTFVVDWETADKVERQSGADTEINQDTPDDLRAIAQLGLGRVVCRINRFGPSTGQEVETAISHGATDLLLPMVEGPDEVERLIRHVDGRASVGILVETVSGCRHASELAQFPLDWVYVGLNDLAISRGTPHIFVPFVDGTAEYLRECFGKTPFGVGGLTVVDGGSPLPCMRLMEEMARLNCAFAFLRRSFKRDIVGRDMALEVQRMREAWSALHMRSQRQIERDHRRLGDCIAQTFN